MNLEVLSEDEHLQTICRELCREFPATQWSIHAVAECSPQTGSDLCLWEYRPGVAIPDGVRWGSRCFALVAARDLEAFRSSHPFAEPGIVLRPVTRAVVRALMAQAAAGASRIVLEADSLRSDRDELLQSLMEANLRLQQYDAERTNFLGRALHDFHAPLTAVTGYCGLLLEQKLGPLEERQKLVITRMQHSVRRLSRMTRAMFQLSVGRHVALRPNLKQSDLRDCADQALSEIQQIAEEKDLQILVDFEPSCSHLMIDPGQMEQVLINLLENACKFSPRSGSIIIKGYSCFNDRRAANVYSNGQPERRMRQLRAPNAYRVDIEDSGPGIAQEHLKSIFEEYVSYSGGQDRSRGGLGLAICRMILQQHEGRIWAGNSPSGAMFSFILPLERVPTRGGEHSELEFQTEMAACL